MNKNEESSSSRQMKPVSKLIGANVPKFISHAPWYAQEEDVPVNSMQHQQSNNVVTNDMDKWYARGLETADQPPAKKYRKGACENCGSMTHKAKDCIERPRKLGAKWTNKNIRADEKVVHVDLGFEAKRDRWNGYDPIAYQKTIEIHQEVEKAQRELLATKEAEEKMKKRAKLAEKSSDSNEKFDIADLSSSDDSDGDDEGVGEDLFKDGTKETASKEKKGGKVTHLRIREDTVKYLRNIHDQSGNYDPKTRTWSESVNRGDGAGDNFVKWTGESRDILKAQTFAWDAHDRGIHVNLQADPTKAEVMRREFEKKKQQVKTSVQSNILDKYGGEEHLKAPPKELMAAQSEIYVEYNAAGQLVKGVEIARVKSKYDEDDYEQYAPGHTAVWGSYYDRETGKWGYACCRSCFKKAYCTGIVEVEPLNHEDSSSRRLQQKSLQEIHVEKLKESKKRHLEM